MRIMNLSTTLICEYLLNDDECIEYLKCTNINPKDYKHIYIRHKYSCHYNKKKQVRILDVEDNLHMLTFDMVTPEMFETKTFDYDLIDTIDLTQYINLIKVQLDEYLTKYVVLPDSVTDLDLGINYDIEITFPPNLLRLELTDEYNHELPELKKLRELHVASRYKHKIILPITLKKLSWFCNKQPPTLPRGLTHLTLANKLALPNNLPLTLTHLKLYAHDTEIHYIPNTITHLTWISNMVLPKLHEGLTYLSLDLGYHHNTHYLPDSITHLLIRRNINIDRFPTQLRYLKWIHCSGLAKFMNDDPSRLEYLIVENNTHDPKYDDKIRLPSNLKHLKWSCKNKLPTLSKSLCTFILNTKQYDHKIMLSTNLKCLVWLCTNKLHSLPNMLTTLELHRDYKHKLPILPNTIIRIKVHCKYKHLNDVRELYDDKIIYDHD
jgi:hypothetical protein